jgi:[CysO sulfur-carrier protein]-S-L-cysteine hydrolase
VLLIQYEYALLVTDMPPYTRLILAEPLLDTVIEHARAELPNECCGLLAGLIKDGVGFATERITIANDLKSPTAYFTNARDLFEAFRRMRNDKIELLAVYHSHPSSGPLPSRRDEEENTYGDTVVHLIVGLVDEEPIIQAWWLSETGYREAVFEVCRS